MKRRKQVYDSKSSFTKLGQFRHYYHGPEQITNIDPSEKENYKLGKRSSQTFEQQSEEDLWVKLRNKISVISEMNPNTAIRSVFCTEKEESKIKPVSDPKAELDTELDTGTDAEPDQRPDINPERKKSTIGMQTDLFYHCKGCRRHIKYGKEIVVSGSESDTETDDGYHCQDCHEARLEVNDNYQECEGSEDVGECDGCVLDQVDEAERDDRCNEKRCREKCGEGDEVDMHDLEDLHSDDDDREERGFLDKQPTIGEEDKNMALITYSLGVKDLTRFCVTMFVMIFLCVSVMMWVLPERVSTKYLSPILHYLLPNLRKTVDTEESTSFWRRCFDCLFSVTYTRF